MTREDIASTIANILYCTKCEISSESAVEKMKCPTCNNYLTLIGTVEVIDTPTKEETASK